MVRRIKIPGEQIEDINDKQEQLKQRLVRSQKHRLADNKFQTTSYTDAAMMLTETDLAISYYSSHKERLSAGHPRYREIVWGHFLARFVGDPWYETLRTDPHKAFATMMHAITELGDIPANELYKEMMVDKSLAYCGVTGRFERIRTPNGTFEHCLRLNSVNSLESLYEGATRMLQVAVDAYVVNYINGWAPLDFGQPYRCMEAYLKAFGMRDVFSMQRPDDLDENRYEPTAAAAIQTSRLPYAAQTVPATIDRNDDETNWRNNGINRMLP